MAAAKGLLSTKLKGKNQKRQRGVLTHNEELLEKCLRID